MSDEPMIRMTDAARKKFLEIIEAEDRKGAGLRVTVRNGNTPQPDFALNFVDPGQDAGEDRIEEVEGIRIYMDSESAKHLDGASIDFIETLTESGFKIDAPAAGVQKPTGPVAEAVQEVLEQKVNPAVAMHGGNVSLVAIDEGTAYLRFGGGCQGCGMIGVTLKQGVEKLIFEAVPQITKVMDVTDHAAGTNPYYQPGK